MQMQSETETACRYCGATHQGVCPLIRAMDFYESPGQAIQALKRVEFFEQKREQACQHSNRDTSMATMGWERWRCKDCGFQYEKDLN